MFLPTISAFLLGLATPPTARWAGSTSALTPPRSGHAAATDKKGDTYLFGGYAEYSGGKPRDVVNDLWRYSNGAWECIEPPTPRTDSTRPGPRLVSACAVVDDELLLFGGWDPETAGTGGKILDDVWALDLTKQTWSQCAPMPNGPVSRHVAANVGGSVVVHTFRCGQSVLVWDKKSRKLIEQPTTGTPPSSRGLHSGAALGEHTLILFGGAAKDGMMSDETFALDTKSWAWETLGQSSSSSSSGMGGVINSLLGRGTGGGITAPSPRAGSCASSIDGGVVVCCGAESVPGGGLNPRSDVWALLADEADVKGTAEWVRLIDDDEGPASRNAASLVPVGKDTLLLTGGWRPFVETYDDSFLLHLTTGDGNAATTTADASTPTTTSRSSTPSMSTTTNLAPPSSADTLFTEYTAAAPPIQSKLFDKCWAIVNEALELTVPNAECDASMFDGALASFVAAGPDDPSLIPEEQRALLTKLADTAASYTRLVDPSVLSWATCYRTLNKPLGAYFCGFSLWPKTDVDVPNLTLYFGSGSAVNPDRVFIRLEMVPRVDTDTDASYAVKYYEPFNERFFELLENSEFEAYVSDSAYARGALAPSGLRYFFDGSKEANLQLAADAVKELAAQWAGFVESAEVLPPKAKEEMAKRDAIIRRVAAENSPDNANRERVFGKEAFAQTKALLSGDGA